MIFATALLAVALAGATAVELNAPGEWPMTTRARARVSRCYEQERRSSPVDYSPLRIAVATPVVPIPAMQASRFCAWA
jgi:hypothetical protein